MFRMLNNEKSGLAPERLVVESGEGLSYIAVFLTFRCNYKCSYCINYHSGRLQKCHDLSAGEWVTFLNALDARSDLPITLQGGEPTIHPEFYDIVKGIDPAFPVDLLTNLQFDTDEFRKHISPERLRRDAPYGSIRVSYHPEVMDLAETIDKALTLQNSGYSIGLYGVLHPQHEQTIIEAQRRCQEAGLDFRTKEFLGVFGDRLYGTYRHPQALAGLHRKRVFCRATELLIDPAGFIYRCHRDLYAGLGNIGHILDPGLPVLGRFRPCAAFGTCNPCDVKLKTNRFQEFGHCSVEIVEAADYLSNKHETHMLDKSAVPMAAE